MTFRIHYTLAGRDSHTDIEGSDVEALRARFKKLYPLAIIRKVKAIK